MNKWMTTSCFLMMTQFSMTSLAATDLETLAQAASNPAAMTAQASPNAFDMRVDISIAGKHVSSPHLTAKAGEMVSTTFESNGEKFYLDLTATDEAPAAANLILYKMEIGTLSETGLKTVLSTPKIISNPGFKTEISQHSDGEPAKHDYALAVTSTRIN